MTWLLALALREECFEIEALSVKACATAYRGFADAVGTVGIEERNGEI